MRYQKKARTSYEAGLCGWNGSLMVVQCTVILHWDEAYYGSLFCSELLIRSLPSHDCNPARERSNSDAMNRCIHQGMSHDLTELFLWAPLQRWWAAYALQHVKSHVATAHREANALGVTVSCSYVRFGSCTWLYMSRMVPEKEKEIIDMPCQNKLS